MPQERNNILNQPVTPAIDGCVLTVFDPAHAVIVALEQKFNRVARPHKYSERLAGLGLCGGQVVATLKAWYGCRFIRVSNPRLYNHVIEALSTLGVWRRINGKFSPRVLLKELEICYDYPLQKVPTEEDVLALLLECEDALRPKHFPIHTIEIVHEFDKKCGDGAVNREHSLYFNGKDRANKVLCYVKELKKQHYLRIETRVREYYLKKLDLPRFDLLHVRENVAKIPFNSLFEVTRFNHALFRADVAAIIPNKRKQRELRIKLAMAMPHPESGVAESMRLARSVARLLNDKTLKQRLRAGVYYDT